jgi:hypothetical protein
MKIVENPMMKSKEWETVAHLTFVLASASERSLNETPVM